MIVKMNKEEILRLIAKLPDGAWLTEDERTKLRSKTFEGIAGAMATQWGK